MAVLKYHAIKRDSNGKIIDEQWIPIYADAINNRVRRDYNLSDLHNVSVARKNLGLVGDVSNITNSHNHDKRYDAWRQADRIENQSALASLDAKLVKTVTDNYTEINSKIDAFKTSFTSLNATTNQRLTTEVSERTAADTALGKRIDGTNTDLGNEKKARTQAEANLQSSIDINVANIAANKASINKTDANLAAETKNRTAADNNLQKNLDTTAANIRSALNTETTNRKSEDSKLQSQVTANKNNLAAEVTNRTKADGNLQTQISSNLNTLRNHTATLNNHTSRLNTLENTVNKNNTPRITALEKRCGTIEANHTKEVSERKTADTNLANRITAHEKMFWVQATDPGAKASATAIWFDTKSKLIKFRSGNTWVPFGATWL